MTISASIYQSFTISLSRFYLAMYESLMSSFGLLFHAAFVLYLVYVGHKYVLDKMDGGDTRDVLVSCIMVTGVYTLVVSSSSYFEYVIRPSFALFSDVLTFMFGIIEKIQSYNPSPTGNADYLKEINTMHDLFQGLDLMALEFIKSCKGLLPSSWSLLNPAWAFITVLAILLLIAVYLTMYLTFIFMFITSYFMMWLLFYVGGVALLLGCFKETRGLFWGWLKMLFNNALVAIFTAMIVAICYSGISHAVFKMTTYSTNTIDFTGDFLGLFIWCILCFTITLKAPDLAAGLTGSIASGTSGIAASASAAGGLAMTGSQFASAGVAKGQMAAGGAVWSNRNNIARSAGSATEALKAKLGIKDPFGPR